MTTMVRYEIYQIPCNEENHGRVFTNWETMEKLGMTFDFSVYEKVYEGSITAEEGEFLPEKLFRVLNLEHPADYKARSLSVSDIVQVGGKYYFCDSFSFREVTDEVSPKLNLHFPAAIIDMFEDFLEEKGVQIENAERNGDEGEAILYGSDYDQLSAGIIDICEKHGISVEDSWD